MVLKDNIPFKGFLFIGLMNDNGKPSVVEYNVRMGDPETEVVIPRIKSDFLELLISVSKGKLSESKIEFDERVAATVMMVSGGYPEEFEKGKVVSGLDKTSGSLVFHAGTKEVNGQVLTNGGRLIAVTSFGDTFNDALKQSYLNTELIEYENRYFRRDLGFDLQLYI